jgi:hypothetical protein
VGRRILNGDQMRTRWLAVDANFGGISKLADREPAALYAGTAAARLGSMFWLCRKRFSGS